MQRALSFEEAHVACRGGVLWPDMHTSRRRLTKPCSPSLPAAGGEVGEGETDAAVEAVFMVNGLHCSVVIGGFRICKTYSLKPCYNLWGGWSVENDTVVGRPGISSHYARSAL